MFKSFLDIADDISSLNGEWGQWERVAKTVPELIRSGNIRIVVNSLPEVKLDGLNKGELKRAYTIVTFIAHAYVRGGSMDNIIKALPAKISSVWIESGNLLGVPPVATYAATVLFNFKHKAGLKAPEDFEIEFTFTGTEDEKWFYAISAAIDIHSERLIAVAERIFDSNADFDLFSREVKESLVLMTGILNKMYEKCRPEVFYGQVRRYLAGWLNDPELPDGLVYELSSRKEILKLAGGSAAQNPTIQLLDILLGVKHGNDADDLTILAYNVNGCPRMNYLGAMRTYMPAEHREYLNNLETKIKEFCLMERFKSSVGYNECIKALANFRSEHIKMVARYIVCQNKSSGSPLGTGGSNPIPFLKKCRDETENCLNK